MDINQEKISVVDADVNDRQFDQICESAVNLVHSLIEILNKAGLDQSNAAGVMAIAAAGVLKGSNVSVKDFSMTIMNADSLWKNEQRNGEDGVMFTPPSHRSQISEMGN